MLCSLLRNDCIQSKFRHWEMVLFALTVPVPITGVLLHEKFVPLFIHLCHSNLPTGFQNQLFVHCIYGFCNNYVWRTVWYFNVCIFHVPTRKKTSIKNFQSLRSCLSFPPKISDVFLWSAVNSPCCRTLEIISSI